MDPNQRPHSREKNTGTGSAHVGKGQRVETGSRPVGSGGRGEGSHSENRGTSSSSVQRAASLKLSPKTLLTLVILVLVAIFLFKSCGGDLFSSYGGLYSELGDSETGGYSSSYQQETFSSDSQLDLSVSSAARSKYYTPAGSGKDTVTIMIYMCGTDLESKYGMATKDLQEMLNATISDKVNIIIETGGCSKWQNNIMSNTKNQVYKLENDGLRRLESDFGTAAMTNPQNLTDFIKYCTKNYPADRNMLIFWDHGGGSITGYGYDEKNPSSSSMTLSKIDSALKAANCKFDIIGFDACLMATLETALVCEDYADYLLASEESEPGTGWYYTNWLTELSKNTSIPTVKLSKTIIDDFISSSRSSSPNSTVTLSVVDLAELDGTVPDTFRSFSSSVNKLIKSNDYTVVSNARAGARQFAQNKINQVDLVDLAQRIGTDESIDLAKALMGCVKYNRSSISRCYGISIFFPYESTSTVKSALASYEDIGIEDEYAKCIKSFASLEYAGQITAGASQTAPSSQGGDLLGTLLSAYLGNNSSSTSPLNVLLGSFTGGGSSSSTGSSTSGGFNLDPATIVTLLSSFSGRSMPSQYDWVDTELISDRASQIAASYINPAHITASKSGGRSILNLTDKEWSLIQTVELNVFVKDGDGYIDLGLDNTFEWYNNDLLLEYDGTWLTINGNVCAYYLVSDTQEEDGSWTTVGRIPALLNGELVNLQVVFDTKNPQGTVTGAYPMYDDNETDAKAKGDIKIKEGDTIELLCDYYNLDGSYSASYTLGTSFTVPKSGLTLRNLEIDTKDVSVTYRLTDIYGNYYWVMADA
ncbi:MAG: clostripain-related cysteine peptidase [Bacillota bacterium]|nr:clostripain-related cysteine peptidase [Bacillota bacterium]